MQKALSYIQDPTEVTVSVDDIKGIWVSSDDKTVISDVQQAFDKYFPKVEQERVVGNSDWAFQNNTPGNNLPTNVDHMVRTIETRITWNS